MNCLYHIVFTGLFFCYLSEGKAVNKPWPTNPDPSYLINYWNYPFEAHHPVTPDGYVLGLFRIPAKRPRAHGTPVLILHGFLSSSGYWYMNGPKGSLGFLLSDAGYDVWMGNIRGNQFSRQHLTLDVNSTEFWNFRIDDISQKDLPTMIDYTLNQTKHKALICIGYSMGGRVILGLLASKPEYNQKIQRVILLASSIFPMYPKGTVLPTASEVQQILWSYFAPLQSVLPDRQSYEQALASGICTNPDTILLCSAVYADFEATRIDQDRAELYKNIYPSGSSSWVILQYFQDIEIQQFTFFDYGEEMNLKKYGKASPDTYDLEKVVSPIFLITSPSDTSKEEVDWMVKHLPQRPDHLRIAKEENFTHADFVYAQDAVRLVYEPIVCYLNHKLLIKHRVKAEIDEDEIHKGQSTFFSKT